MPCSSLIFCRTEELAAGSIFSNSRFFSDTPRFTSFCDRISITAFSVYSSWLASWIVRALKLDLRLRILQVEARVDLLGGLVDGVLHFLQVDLAHYVEAVIRCHVSIQSTI